MTRLADLGNAAERVRAKIEAAFPDLVFCGAVTGADGLPNEELDEERALYGALHGKSWSKIPPSFIERNPDAIVLLTDKAFGAFLPAWLISALMNEEVRKLFVYVFSPRIHKSMEVIDSRIRPLTPPQKEALLDFFSYSADFESSLSVQEHAQASLTHLANLVARK